MTSGQRRRRGKSVKPARTTMADYAMSFNELGLWMSARAKSATPRRAEATSLSMLDGAIAAVVAGPVSMMPEEWLCPLLGVDPDDFNHDTRTFSAIAAALMHHNAVSETLSTHPDGFEPLFMRGPGGEMDARDWCMGFYAAMKPRLRAWAPLLNPNVAEQVLLIPILCHCVDAAGRPILDRQRTEPNTRSLARDTARAIPSVVESIRQFWMPIRFARDPGTQKAN